MALPALHEAGLAERSGVQDLIRRTGVEIDYRFKLETVDLWRRW